MRTKKQTNTKPYNAEKYINFYEESSEVQLKKLIMIDGIHEPCNIYKLDLETFRDILQKNVHSIYYEGLSENYIYEKAFEISLIDYSRHHGNIQARSPFKS